MIIALFILVIALTGAENSKRAIYGSGKCTFDFGTTLTGCSSGNVIIDSFTAVTPSGVCTIGEMVTVDLDLTIHNPNIDIQDVLWDLGIQISTNGGNPITTGTTCINTGLLPANDINPNLLSGIGPYIKLDSAGECGDLGLYDLSSNPLLNRIKMDGVTIPCNQHASGGLAIGIGFSWFWEGNSHYCVGADTTGPGIGDRCQGEIVNVAGVTPQLPPTTTELPTTTTPTTTTTQTTTVPATTTPSPSKYGSGLCTSDMIANPTCDVFHIELTPNYITANITNSSSTECIVGNNVTLDLEIIFGGPFFVSFDVGIQIAKDGGNAITGDCMNVGLIPVGFPVDSLSGHGPYFNHDNPSVSFTDVCGDLATDNVKVIVEGVEIPCAMGSGGNLDIGIVFSWSTLYKECLGPDDTGPQTASMCQSYRPIIVGVTPVNPTTQTTTQTTTPTTTTQTTTPTTTTTLTTTPTTTTT
ncbi:hypothetical protein KAU11_11530, partial [Candidatus Babeliales bacterium]|nr:hypothetical protein [Candidatus Babeliales bacterium]